MRNVGKQNQLITYRSRTSIEVPSGVDYVLGDPIQIKADVRPLSHKEALENGLVREQRSYKVSIRKNPNIDLDSDYELEYNGVKMNVLRWLPNNHERRFINTIMYERVNGGN